MKRLSMLFLSVLFLSCPRLSRAEFNFTEAPAALPSDPGTVDYYSGGMALFQQKQYAQALSFFQQTVQQKPDFPGGYYHMAYCQYLTGDLKNATLNFYFTDLKKSNPAIKAYADKLKAKLSLADAAWVEQQLLIGPPSGEALNIGETRPALNLSLASTPAPAAAARKASSGQFALHFSTSLVFVNLEDIKEEGESLSLYAASYQASDPSIVYTQFTPSALGSIEISPMVSFPDFEIGGRLSFTLPSQAEYRIADYYGYYDDFKIGLGSASLGASARLYLKAGDSVKFFMEPFLGMRMAQMSFEINYEDGSGPPLEGRYGYNADQFGLDASLKAGVQIKAGENFMISLSGGFEYARFDNLKGKWFDDQYPNYVGIYGRAYMDYDSLIDKYLIWFAPELPSQNYLFYSSPADFANAKPLVLDFSGIQTSVDFAFLF